MNKISKRLVLLKERTMLEYTEQQILTSCFVDQPCSQPEPTMQAHLNIPPLFFRAGR